MTKQMSRGAQKRKDAIAASAERSLSNTSFDTLRGRGAVRIITATNVLALVLLPASWVIFGQLVGVGSVLLWAASFVTLRICVRHQADLPDEVLDERTRSQRDAVYLDAYWVVGGVSVLAAFAALVALGGQHDVLKFRYEHVSAVFWTALALLLSAPSIAYALKYLPFSNEP